MSNDILGVEITATATKAEKTIDSVIGKLQTLSNELSKVDGSNLSGLANGVAKLGTATRTLSGVKANDYTRIANGFKKFAEIDSSKFSKLSSGLNLLSVSISRLGSASNTQSITPTINAIKNLARVDMTGFDTSKMQTIGSSIANLANSLSGISAIDGSVTKVVSSMARLANSGQHIGNVTSQFPLLGKSVVSLVSDLSKSSAIDASITKVVDGIARLASAGEKTGKTVANLDKLGEGVMNLLKKLQKAPQINANVANTVQGLGNLAASGSRISAVSGNATGATKKFGSALSGLRQKIKSTNKSSKGFVSSIGMFYAKCFLLIRAVKKLGSAITTSMDYVEDLNYFNAAFGQVADKADLSDYKKIGYKSAEEYYNSFSARAEQLTQKMSGFKVSKSGLTLSTGKKSMGIDPSLVMNYQAMFSQMASSMDVTSEMSLKLSNTLTKLGADLASVKNQDFKTVWENMASGMTGMSRAVDKYGMNIRVANLQQQLANMGISASVSKLSQQEKILLRTIVILNSSRYAWTDMSRTIEQPANQLRLLQSNFANLGRTIGNIFLPIVAKLLPYLNAIVIVLQRFAEGIVKLLGFKDFDWGGVSGTGSSNFDLGDAADDSEDISKNMDKTAKKSKKVADNLQGFDIINKLQKNEDSSSSPSTSAGGLSPADLAKLNSQLDKLMEEYNKKWKEAFDKMTNKAQKLADKIQKALIEGWKKGDFTKLGVSIANWINKGLSRIPWAKIKNTVKKIAKSIATFLNGFIDKLDWKLVGKTLSNGLNTMVDGAYTFFKTFNFLKFGQKIKEGITSAIKTFNAKKAGRTLGLGLRGMIQFAFGVMVDFPYKNLGKKIGDYINGFLAEMAKVRKNTGLTGWQELGKTISDGIKGILDTINTALEEVQWAKVGKAIADFLGQIDWFGILASLGKTIANALWAAIKVAVSTFASDPIGVGKTIIAVLGGFMAYKRLKALTPILCSGMYDVFKNGISAAINKLHAGSIVNKCNGVFSKIGSKIGTAISGYIALNIESAVITGAGQFLIDNSEEGDPVNNFGIGVKRFGEFTNKLLSLDFSGVASDLNAAGDTLAAVIDYKTYSDKQDAIKNGNKSTYDRNKQAKYDATEYQYQLNNYGKKSADNYLNKLSPDAKKAAQDLLAISTSLESFKKNMKKFGSEGSIAVNLVTKAFDKGQISTSAYKKLISKTYKSYSDFNVALRKARNAQKYMNGDMKAYNALSKKMEKSLKNIGYSSSELTSVQETLNMKLQNGEISFEDYQKIVGKSYKSTKELYDQVNKVAGKKVATSVVADVKGTEKVGDLGKKLGKVTSKNIRVVAETKGIKDIETLKKAMGSLTKKGLTNKTISATISPKLRKDWYKLLKNQIQAKKFSLDVSASINNVSVGKLKSSVKSMDGRKINYDKLTAAINNAKNRVTIGQQGQIFVSGADKALIKYLKKYGINYETYAQGGIPEDGWFRASRGELMGKFDNGQSMVANNRQVMAGVSQTFAPAVYAATKAAIKEVIGEMPTGGGDVYLDGVKVTTAVMSNAKKISKNRGVAWNLT